MAGELGERYDELSTLRASDVTLIEYRESRHILSTYIRSCGEHLRVDYAAIWIASRKEIYPGGVSYENASTEVLQLLEQLSSDAFSLFQQGHDGFGINDKDEKLRSIINLPADKKVLLTPVFDSMDRPCGVLSCLNEFYHKDFTNSDKSTLDAVARKTQKYLLSAQDDLTGLSKASDLSGDTTWPSIWNEARGCWVVEGGWAEGWSTSIAASSPWTGGCPAGSRDAGWSWGGSVCSTSSTCMSVGAGAVCSGWRFQRGAGRRFQGGAGRGVFCLFLLVGQLFLPLVAFLGGQRTPSGGAPNILLLGSRWTVARVVALIILIHLLSSKECGRRRRSKQESSSTKEGKEGAGVWRPGGSWVVRQVRRQQAVSASSRMSMTGAPACHKASVQDATWILWEGSHESQGGPQAADWIHEAGWSYRSKWTWSGAGEGSMKNFASPPDCPLGRSKPVGAKSTDWAGTAVGIRSSGGTGKRSNGRPSGPWSRKDRIDRGELGSWCRRRVHEKFRESSGLPTWEKKTSGGQVHGLGRDTVQRRAGGDRSSGNGPERRTANRVVQIGSLHAGRWCWKDPMFHLRR